MLVVGSSMSGIRHSQCERLVVLCLRLSFFLIILTSASSNVASHPASQSLPMETREMCVMPGIMWAYRACSGNCGSDNWQASCVVD